MDCALVAVSGGSDSLALLDMLISKNEYKLIVCHVNYNYRESSKRDEQIVVSYCRKHKIKYFILNLESKEEKQGNFEDWARVKRYKFFKKIYQQENCKCLFVGHQKEDVIETYLLQKERGGIVENYGLAKKTQLQGMEVVRPLLDYTKKELEDYCKEKNIEFGIDETNFDLSYRRNKIRHEIIAKMSDKNKDDLIKEINELNKEREAHVKRIKKIKEKCLKEKNVLDLEEYHKLDKLDKKEVLYYFLIDNIYKKISIKSTRLEDIIKKIDSSKPNIVLACYDDITLYKEYKLLVIEKNIKEYCYEIVDLEKKLIGENFCIKETGKKLEKVVVKKEDFPLYLKNYNGDNKNVNRIFIDKKIPLRQRKSWPVIVDKLGGLLLVVGIKKFYNEGCSFEDNFVEFYVCENKKNKGE